MNTPKTVHSSYVWKECIYAVSVFIECKNYINVSVKSLLALNALRDIYALAIHNIKLSRERQESQFLTYPIPEFYVGDNVLIIYHLSDVWDPKYYVVCVIGCQL